MMGAVSTVYLVHGYLAAGKTTCARRLEKETGAIRFSVDEWYLRLHVGDEPTEHLDSDRWERLISLLDEVWTGVAARGVDVILDFGFWSRSARDRARSLAASLDAQVVLYSLVCDEATAKQRCLVRNEHPNGSFIIHDSAFEQLRSKFDPLQFDETAVIVNGAD